MPSIANSNAATKQEIRDVCSMTVFADFAANDATPSVAAGGTFKTANTVATTITNFDNGYEGQVLRVVIDDANTTVDFTASNLIGNGGLDWSPSLGDSFTAVRDFAGNWYCQLSGSGSGGGVTDHALLTNIGINTHAEIDTHMGNASIHITDHTQLTNIGSNSHNQIDTTLGEYVAHASNSTIHFTVASIDHTAILNVGTNTHAQIDTHIADTSIHFTQAEISITKDQISDLVNWIAANNGSDFTVAPIASAAGAIAQGEMAEAAGENSLALLTGAYAGNQGNIAIGANAIAHSTFTGVNPPNNIAIGADNQAIGDEGSLAVGSSVTVSASNATGIGKYLEVRDENDVKIGLGDTNELHMDYSTGNINHVVDSVTKTITGTIYVNDSLSSLYNLPIAVKGMKYVFENTTGTSFIVNPQDTEYFAGSAAGEYKSLDAIETYISIKCFRAGVWHVTAQFGTVSDE